MTNLRREEKIETNNLENGPKTLSYAIFRPEIDIEGFSIQNIVVSKVLHLHLYASIKLRMQNQNEFSEARIKIEGHPLPCFPQYKPSAITMIAI